MKLMPTQTLGEAGHGITVAIHAGAGRGAEFGSLDVIPHTVNASEKRFFLAATFALLLSGCASSDRRVAYERGTLDIAAQKYGWLLPEADRIEISALGKSGATATNGFPSRVAGVSVHHIGQQKTITGEQATEFRKKWTSMMFWWGFSAMCHEPAYGLRFFRGQSLLLEMTVCWKCSNFEVPTPLGYRFMGFDEKRPEAESVRRSLQEHLPLPEETKNVRN
jgi:hypothetical protein